MKKTVGFICVAALFVINSSFSFELPSKNYMIDLTVGEVEVSRNNGASWFLAEVDTILNAHDIIRTGRDSYCEVSLPENQGTFRVLENTEIMLSSLGKVFHVNLRRGRSLFDIFRPLFADESFDVESETAIASVRGTEFVVENTGESLTVSVVHGTVSASRNVPPDVDPDLIETLREAVEVKLVGGEEMQFQLLDNQKFMNTVKMLTGSRHDLKNYLLNARKEIRREVRTFNDRARIMSVIDEHQADLQRIQQRKNEFQPMPAGRKPGNDLQKLYRFKRASDSLLPRRMANRNKNNQSASHKRPKKHKKHK